MLYIIKIKIHSSCISWQIMLCIPREVSRAQFAEMSVDQKSFVVDLIAEAYFMFIW